MVLIMESSSTNVTFLVLGCFLYWAEGEESADGVSLPTPKALCVLAVTVKPLVHAAPSPPPSSPHDFVPTARGTVGTGLNGVRVRVQDALNRFFQVLHTWRVSCLRQDLLV